MALLGFKFVLYPWGWRSTGETCRKGSVYLYTPGMCKLLAL